MQVFDSTPDDLDMHVIYDVSHNIAKQEEHMVDGQLKRLLVHRKGSTRAFPPHHPLIPVDYQFTGQPVLIGGTMGTCSYVLTGTDKGMAETFGSTCHGAGRYVSQRVSISVSFSVSFFSVSLLVQNVTSTTTTSAFQVCCCTTIYHVFYFQA